MGGQMEISETVAFHLEFVGVGHFRFVRTQACVANGRIEPAILRYPLSRCYLVGN